MPHSAPQDSDRPESGPQLPGLTEALRRALTELDASAIGVTRAAGGPPKYFTRNALAAQFFEDVCAAGLESLKAQTQAKDGVFGTNRVRADSGGPVRGRLIAISLRSDKGVPLGILIAVRMIEEAKFGSKESQKLLVLAREFAKLLTPKRATATAPAASAATAPPVAAASAPVVAPTVTAAPAIAAPATSTVMIGPVSFTAPVIAEYTAAPVATPASPPAFSLVAPAAPPASATAVASVAASTPVASVTASAPVAAPAATPASAAVASVAASTPIAAPAATVSGTPVVTAASPVAAAVAASKASAAPRTKPAAPAASSQSMWPSQRSTPAPKAPDPEPTAPPISFDVHSEVTDLPSPPVIATPAPPVAPIAPISAAAPVIDVPAISVPAALPVYPEAVARATSAARAGSADALPSDVAAKLLERSAEPTVDAGDTVASLLDWTAFERQIRAQELLDRLPGCVLYGDMDQLHVVNKLAGFAVGDLAISEVGAALQTSDLPQGSCACHLSGDRFTVYAPRTTLAQGRRLAEQLSKTVAGLSVNVHGVPSPLSISFGVALIPASEGGLGHALAAAEAACKAAKDRGRGRIEVYQDADQSIVRRNDDVLVADRLRQALDAGRVEVFAQPIVSLHGALESPHYELLVRLIGEAGTHLSPTWFMSAATRYRMLVELDRAVIAHVLGKLESRRDELMKRKLRFSVNLSGPTIGDPDFLEWIAPRIGGGGVPGEWLQFEITETAAVANVMQTQAMIRRLQARGVQFALDDFGTGVSSFAYLKFFDVSMLKLDGSFVRDLLSNPRSESLVRGIAQLGRGMNIVTVAECVETGAVRDRLTELGIDCAQGFLFGRPRPLDGVLSEQFAVPAAATPAA